MYGKARRPIAFIVLGLLIIVSGAANAQTVLYVDDSATGANNGSSWCNAFITLQPAINAAMPGNEIHVAQGTYMPAAVGGPRTATFSLKNGVAIQGGYAGCGASSA